MLMNFLFPTFLFGLLAIAIPVIIHLFNFKKYKKVYFTNVAFLKELKQESDSKSKLKEWLILAMRILAITCLVLAFAQPIIPSKLKNIQGEKAISVFVDNSFSMEATNKQGTLLENAKQYAADIANAFSASDKFQLLTNDFEGKHQRFLSKEEFIEQLNEIKISSASKNTKEILKRQQDFLQNAASKNKKLFIISDFQKSNVLFDKQAIDSTALITFLPIKANEENNVFIDSIWFETPVQQIGSSQLVYATVINKSDKNIESGSLKLVINGEQVALSTFNVSANNKADISMAFTIKNKGINNGELKIDDYPITFDDVFYFSFNAEATINALVINGKDSQTAQNFRSLMQRDSLFAFHENSEASIDFGLFKQQQLIVLNELSTLSSGLATEVQKFVRNGGSVIIFPSKQADLLNYNNTFQNWQLPQLIKLDTVQTKTQQLVFEQGLYKGVFDKINQQMDLPIVWSHYQLKKSNSASFENILLLQNGESLLSKHQYNKGSFYLFSAPSNASCTNFLKHALFVPTIIKIAVLSIKATPLYYYTSSNQAITVPSSFLNVISEKSIHIIKNDSLTGKQTSNTDVIPERRLINNQTILFTQNQLSQAGYYAITDNTTLFSNIALNYSRKESDMSFYNTSDLQKIIDEEHLSNITIANPSETNLSASLKETSDGKKLWKLFLILALLFLLSEIAIIRLVK